MNQKKSSLKKVIALLGIAAMLMSNLSPAASVYAGADTVAAADQNQTAVNGSDQGTDNQGQDSGSGSKEKPADENVSTSSTGSDDSSVNNTKNTGNTDTNSTASDAEKNDSVSTVSGTTSSNSTDSSEKNSSSAASSSNEAASSASSVAAESKIDTVSNFESVSTDGTVKATAVLSVPGSIPADAKLVVTPITSGSAYDAYMEVLEKNASSILGADKKVDTSKTLLYDVAFIGPEKDADGNPTGNEIEYEPTSGTVSISMEMLNNQLTDQLGAQDKDDIKIIHLPLADGKLAAGEKSVDAAITADDVVIDNPVSTDVSLDGTQTVSATLGSLSTVGILIPIDGSHEGYDLYGYIDGQKSYVKLNGQQIDSNTELHYNDILNLRIAWNVPNTLANVKAGDTFTYQLPSFLNWNYRGAANNGSLKNDANEIVGNFNIAGNTLTIIYSQDQGSNLTGRVDITGKIDSSLIDGTKDTTVHFDFMGIGNVVVSRDSTYDGISIQKSDAAPVEGNPLQREFVLMVTAVGPNQNNVVVNDTMGNDLSFVQNSIKVSRDGTNYTDYNGQFPISVGDLSDGTQSIPKYYYIKYRVELLNSIWNDSNAENRKNTAKVTSSSNINGATDYKYVNINKNWINKDGAYDWDKHELTWTITINQGDTLDIGGSILQDLGAAVQGTTSRDLGTPTSFSVKAYNPVTGEEVADNSISGLTWDTLIHGFTFPSGSKNKYIIKYTNTVSSDVISRNYTNTATIKPFGPSGTEIQSPKDVWVGVGDGIATFGKTCLTPTGTDTIIQWESTITTKEDITNAEYTDYVESDYNNSGKHSLPEKLDVKITTDENGTLYTKGTARIIRNNDNQFTICFYPENGKEILPANTTLHITYSTLLDQKKLPTAGTSRDYKNAAAFGTEQLGSIWAEATHKYITDATEHLHKYAAGYSNGEETWRLAVYPLRNYKSTDTVTITDTLPDNMDFVDGSLTCNTNWNTTNQSLNGITASTSIDTNNKKIVTFTIGGDALSTAANQNIYIYYRTKVNSYIEGTTTYTNTAFMTYNGENEKTVSANVQITSNVLEKEKVYTVESAPAVHYTVNINKDCINLDPNKDTLTLTDVMGKDLQLVSDSITITDADHTQATSIANCKGYTWKSEETDTGTVMTITVPDSKYIQLKYDAIVKVAPGTDVSATSYNTATLSGSALIKSTTVQKIDTEAIACTGYSKSDYRSIKAYKYHQEGDSQVALSKAVFDADEVTVDKNGKTWTVKENTVISPDDWESADGGYTKAITSLLCDRIYSVQEDKAPSGYVKSPDKQYFVFVGENSKKEDFTGVKIIDGSETYNLQVFDASQTYNQFSFNNELESGSLVISKLLSGVSAKDGDYTYNFIISKDGVNGEYLTFNESLKYTGSTTNQNDATKISVKNGDSQKVTLTGIPTGDYTVTEVNPEETKIAGYRFDVSSTNTASVKITTSGAVVNIENKYAANKVVFSKQNIGGKEIAGAKIQILDTSNNIIKDKDGNSYTWTSEEGKCHEITGIPAGTYVMHEVAAPSGYMTASDIQFTVADDGTVSTQNTADMKNGNIVMTDKDQPSTPVPTVPSATTVMLSKQDIGGNEIAGASIQILDANGKVAKDGTGKDASWISEAGKTHVLTGMTAGTYTMHEVSAPTGYLVATDITFTISGDGTVTTKNGSDMQNGKIVMTDQFSKNNTNSKTFPVTFSKVNASGTQIAGAQLVVKNAAGATVASWTTAAGESYTVRDLVQGTYTLHETAAPENYKVADDITFTVAADGTVTSTALDSGKIVMIDAENVSPTPTPNNNTNPTPTPTPGTTTPSVPTNNTTPSVPTNNTTPSVPTTTESITNTTANTVVTTTAASTDSTSTESTAAVTTAAAKASSTTSASTSTVKTGDSTNAALYIMMMAAAAGAILLLGTFALNVRKKKDRNQKQ